MLISSGNSSLFFFSMSQLMESVATSPSVIGFVSCAVNSKIRNRAATDTFNTTSNCWAFYPHTLMRTLYPGSWKSAKPCTGTIVTCRAVGITKIQSGYILANDSESSFSAKARTFKNTKDIVKRKVQITVCHR